MKLGILVLFLTLTIPEIGVAQQPAATPKVEKQPPPPLYPKHRRGIYTNGQGVEVIDATPQSPPLNTDDPGVPAKGAYEINFATEGDLSRDRRVIDLLLVDANYGLAFQLAGHEVPTQLSLEFPLSGAKEPAHPFQIGVGEAELGFKFNFYNSERRGMAFSFYPQLEFAVPGSNAAQKGIAETGQTLVLPLLVQRETKYFTAVANGGIHAPIHDSGRDVTASLAFGIGRALTPHVAIMGDFHGESTFDFSRDRLVVADFGLMRRIHNVILFTSIGHSIVSDGSSGHTYIEVGMKLQSKNSK